MTIPEWLSLLYLALGLAAVGLLSLSAWLLYRATQWHEAQCHALVSVAKAMAALAGALAAFKGEHGDGDDSPKGGSPMVQNARSMQVMIFPSVKSVRGVGGSVDDDDDDERGLDGGGGGSDDPGNDEDGL